MLISRSSTLIYAATRRTLTKPLLCRCYRQCCSFHSAIGHRQQQQQQQQRNDTEKPSEYNLNVGFAIATLQNDLPNFFKDGLTEHSIYSPDIVLSDPHYTKFSFHGRTAYLGIAQMLRWSTSIYFDDILLEITKMRDIPESEDIDGDDYLYSSSKGNNNKDNYHAVDRIGVKTVNSSSSDKLSSSYKLLSSTVEQAERDLLFKGTIRKLEVKWKMLGTKNATFFNPQPRIRYIEGVFVYTFDDDGLIGEHRIQRIVPPPSRRVLWLHSWGVRLRSLFWEKRAPLLNPGF